MVITGDYLLWWNVVIVVIHSPKEIAAHDPNIIGFGWVGEGIIPIEENTLLCEFSKGGLRKTGV